MQYRRYSVRILALLSPNYRKIKFSSENASVFFPATLRRRNLKTLVNTGDFGFVFEGNSVSWGNQIIMVTSSISNSPFFKMFFVHGAKKKSRRFQFPLV